MAVVPRNHPIRGRSTAFHELLDYDMVGLEGSTPLMALLHDAARAAGKLLRLRVQVYSFDVVCRMIAARQGIGVLPKMAARTYCRDLNLRLVALTDKWALRSIYLCVRDEPLAASAQKMVDHLLGPAAAR